jgi:peptidoglycan/xylan/chitin deacetylase (PgdA/CDA1 family)
MIRTRQRVLDAALDLSFVSRAVDYAAPTVATIFLCHRFDAGLPGQHSHSRDALVDALEWLTRRRYRLVGVEEIVEAQRGARPPIERAVAFTMDDGYKDQGEIATLFGRYDCPVSIFLTTGFLDGSVVLWWDQLAEILERAEADVATELPDGPLHIGPSDPRRPALRALEERCKAWTPDVRDAAIATIAAAVGTDVPDRPAGEAQPMTWHDARALEATGLVRFGPHTVSHPILRVLDGTQARDEIVGSWRRLEHELANPLPVFCYPNGRAVDFGQRDAALVREAGCVGALMAEAGYADPRSPDAFRIRRVPFPEDLHHVKRWVSGFERLRTRFVDLDV